MKKRCRCEIAKDVLELLRKRGPLHKQAILCHANLNDYRFVRNVSPLVKNGYIEKNGHNGNGHNGNKYTGYKEQIYYSITPKGLEMYVQLLNSLNCGRICYD